MEEAHLKKTYMPQSYYKEMKCIGVEDIDGDKCYKLELTKPNGSLQTDFYSAESKLHFKSITEFVSNTSKMKISIKMGDCREVDGIKMPFKMETAVTGASSQVIEFSKVRLNVEIPEGAFELPGEIKELADQQE